MNQPFVGPAIPDSFKATRFISDWQGALTGGVNLTTDAQYVLNFSPTNGTITSPGLDLKTSVSGLQPLDQTAEKGCGRECRTLTTETMLGIQGWIDMVKFFLCSPETVSHDSPKKFCDAWEKGLTLPKIVFPCDLCR